MSDVSFDEEQNVPRYAPTTSTKKSGIAGLIIRTGLAKTESQANIVMISIIVVAFIAMIFIWMPHGSKSVPATLPSSQAIPGAQP